MNISFIIPVYNTEDYLENCLLSIINQNIPEEEYEIILVDDGSTDNSKIILSDFEQKYSQIKLVTQENRGQGAARNRALLEAKGDYIFFVDSDDYILPNTLEVLLQNLFENKESDIIFFNSLQEKHLKITPYITRPSQLVNELSGVEYLINYKTDSVVCNTVFSRKFVEKYNIRMPEGIFNEDEVFMLELLLYAHKVSFFHFPIYVYVRRDGSVTRPFSKEKEKCLIDDFRTAINKILFISKKENLSNEQRLGVKRKLDWCVVDMLIRLSRISFELPFHEEVLDEMIENKIFPLPPHKYSWKYNLFRVLFKNKRNALFLFKMGVKF